MEMSWLSSLSVGRGYVLLTPSLTIVSSRKFLMSMRCSEGGTTEGGLVEGTAEWGRPKFWGASWADIAAHWECVENAAQ